MDHTAYQGRDYLVGRVQATIARRRRCQSLFFLCQITFVTLFKSGAIAESKKALSLNSHPLFPFSPTCEVERITRCHYTIPLFSCFSRRAQTYSEKNKEVQAQSLESSPSPVFTSPLTSPFAPLTRHERAHPLHSLITESVLVGLSLDCSAEYTLQYSPPFFPFQLHKWKQGRTFCWL